MKRRVFFKGLGSLVGFGALTSFYSWQVEPFWLEFVHLKMPVKNLPDNLIGKTLMQISDIHVGPIVRNNFLKDSFRRAAKLEPDFVVYTGDFVHYEGPQTLVQLQQIAQNFIKGKIGTAGILGNHDYGKSWADPNVAHSITEILESFHIPMLRNDQIETEGLNFMGIDDYWGTNFFPEEIMQKYDSGKANIILCHNPDVCDVNIWNGYQGWILAGHTHGGQVKPPFLDAPVLPVENKRYDKGKIDLKDGRILYINRALGHLWQVRFNVRPEITIFELEKA